MDIITLVATLNRYSYPTREMAANVKALVDFLLAEGVDADRMRDAYRMVRRWHITDQRQAKVRGAILANIVTVGKSLEQSGDLELTSREQVDAWCAATFG